MQLQHDSNVWVRMPHTGFESPIALWVISAHTVCAGILGVLRGASLVGDLCSQVICWLPCCITAVDRTAAVGSYTARCTVTAPACSVEEAKGPT